MDDDGTVGEEDGAVGQLPAHSCGRKSALCGTRPPVSPRPACRSGRTAPHPGELAQYSGVAAAAEQAALVHFGAIGCRLLLEISEYIWNGEYIKRLRDFRAGIEACISFVKRVFGLT